MLLLAAHKKSRPARSARRVFAQHRFPPSSLYFPRIALNVFAKIGLPLISLPTLPPYPLSLLSYLCHIAKKKEREKPPSVLIDHSTWNVSHRPAQRRKSDAILRDTLTYASGTMSASCPDISDVSEDPRARHEGGLLSRNLIAASSYLRLSSQYRNCCSKSSPINFRNFSHSAHFVHYEAQTVFVTARL